MHNIHELEKRWFSYKIKSFIPHFSFLLISIISITIFINIDTPSITTPEVIEKKVPIKIKVVPEVKKEIQKPVKVKKQEKVVLLKVKPIPAQEQIILTPSFDFIKKLRNDSTNQYKSNTFSQNNNQVIQETYQQDKIKAKKEVVVKTEEKRKEIKIFKKETQADIEHVIKRFKKNNNPALSLFVAKKYYRIANYKQAYNYALLTNQLNNNIDESWIIFTKSLVKLNQKEKSIKILRKYIKYSHSSNAKVLLDDILSGKFK